VKKQVTENQYAGGGGCQSLVSLLWPSFIVAGLATILFFTVFDPLNIVPNFSRIGTYSVGFFLFWLLGVMSSAGTQYFMKPCDSVKAKRVI
jgi:hypothetical protein